MARSQKFRLTPATIVAGGDVKGMAPSPGRYTWGYTSVLRLHFTTDRPAVTAQKAEKCFRRC